MCSYLEVKVTLWGECASAFNVEQMFDPSEGKPVVVLFVGTLMKKFQSMSSSPDLEWPIYTDIFRLLTVSVSQIISILVPTRLPGGTSILKLLKQNSCTTGTFLCLPVLAYRVHTKDRLV